MKASHGGVWQSVDMCRRVTCDTCGKPTYAGCGEHIEEVLGDVPVDQRCQGHSAGSEGSAPKSFLKTILGRK
jgi:hypothetical protein